MAQLQAFAPTFTRFEITLDGDYLHLEVWEADDRRYLSRSDHAHVYEHCTPSDVFEVISSTLDSLGLPDPF